MLHALITWLVDTVGVLGYPGIVLLMGLESSFFPFPSEVVMVPAGYLASQGQMNLSVIIVCGITGSLLGAWLNYFIALKAGRAALLKWGHLIFLPEEKFLRVEKYLKEHGEIGTFIGRLIPVIRQYISFPAGVIRMNFAKFSLFTGLGAGLWVTVLALIGYTVGENAELVSAWSQKALFWVLLGCILLMLVYWKLKKK
jgi:membrane protein DedA with SNARE-associated domain